MLASFAVIPMGTEGGVKHLVAEVLKIVDESGLPYSAGAMTTTMEGEQDEVMQVIMRCHRRMLELVPRVLTNISIDDRKGYMIESFKLRGLATRFGYTRGSSEEGGWFYEYLKNFPGLGIQTHITFSGNRLPEEARQPFQV